MNKNDKPLIYRRVFAYIIDMLIVSIIESIITIAFPSNKVYEDKLKEASTITQQYRDKEINQEEYLEKYNNISYELNKSSIDSSIVIVAITIVYFVLMYKFNDGKTIGKQFMKLKLVSSNDRKIGINNYLLRCLLINSALSNIISIILLMFANKNTYLLVNDKISTVISIFYVACVFFILYRDDGRGLHDFICNTKVVQYKKEDINNKENIESSKEKNNKKEVIDATIVSENEENNK